MIKGEQSILFDKPVYIEQAASIVGQKEGEGPLGNFFDIVELDPMAGTNTWEEAESKFQEMVIEKLLSKSDIQINDVRFILGGDLLAQLIGTSFGLMKFNKPIFGLYSACSTFGEAVGLSSMIVSGGFAENVIAIASSHFASAEKQFRFPLEYGNQRPDTSTWTITGAGAVMITNKHTSIKISGITTGKIVDYGVKDSMNMGACMAPAAADLINANFKDFGVDEKYYDKIITGDLGKVGRNILIDLLKEKGYDLTDNHMDCGIEIFNAETQDTKSGGSGCGCSAVTFCSYILRQLQNKEWKRVLFLPTGALLSTVSYNEGKSVPGIAHGVIIERSDYDFS